MLMEKLDLGPAPRVLELLRFECQTLPDQTVEVSGRVGNIGTRPLRLNTWIILDREGATQADTFRTHGKVGEQAVPPGGALEFKFSFFFPEDFAERCTVDTFVDEESGKVVPYTNKTGRGRKTS